MRNQSIGRSIIENISLAWKYLKNEFGIWAYGIVAFFAFVLYKPVKHLFDKLSAYIGYGLLIAIGVLLLYLLISKIFRSRK